MGATTGLETQDYSGAATGGAAIDILTALIPDPDAPHGSGAAAAGGDVQSTFLDEMSPAAAAQLLAELAAMRAVIAAFA